MEGVWLDAHRHVWDDGRIAGDWQAGFSSGTKFIINGTSPNDWCSVKGFCDEHSGCKAAYGVHPWKVNELPSNWRELLKEYLATGAVSVGEIGLDGLTGSPSWEKQEAIFVEQWNLAIELNLSPSVHCVKAWAGMSRAIKSLKAPTNGWLLHGFIGSIEEVKNALDLGAFISISANIQNPHQKRLHKAVKWIPLDRILIESDGSVDHPERGTFSELKTTYEHLAKAKDCSLEALQSQVAINFNQLFGQGKR